MKNWKNEYATEKDKEMKKERSTTKKTTTADTGAEALSHVIPLSKVVEEGAKKGKVNNLYGT